MSDFFKKLSTDTKQSLKILVIIIIGVIVALSCYVCSDEEGGIISDKNIKTYVYEETSSTGAVFHGEFTIDFEKEKYTYSGHDIDLMQEYFIFQVVAHGAIEKSGDFYDLQETRNNQKKYLPSHMDYYAWVSTDYQTLKYAGYTFTLK
ncbi:MAG: hypothetical protein E7343_03480 [Clostridiales bacterium]|nr:hypothetical protein [Clostridiales bacterium]